MKNLKKTFSFLLALTILVTVITACGSGTSPTKNEEQTVENSNDKLVESQDEGSIQDEIKSYEDIAALQEEEENGITDAPSDMPESGIDKQQPSGGNIAQDYVSVDNFRNGNEFDLEGYLYANGAKWIKKGYDYHDNTGFHESDTEITCYFAYFDTTHWMVTVQELVSFEYRGYIVDGEKWYGPYHTALWYKPPEGENTITNTDMYISDTEIEILDDMLYMSFCHPDTDNPFQFSDKCGYEKLYYLSSSNTDIPDGATHR